eukprot:5954656-Lingulodinium_polyedra.AAC.1
MPEVAEHPPLAASICDGHVARVLDDFQNAMLRDAQAYGDICESGTAVKPYMDSVLAGSPN